MYHPTTRVLAVLALLRAHGRMTGPELARRLEVDERTVRRYITMLQDLGVPVEAERGRGGAYQMAADFRMPPLAFTNDEALALALGLLAAEQFGVDEITAAVESARAKLEEAMPDELTGRVRALTETVTLDVGAARAAASRKVMLTLSEAAQGRRRVHLRYQAPREAPTERDFDPYGLAHRQGHWYVVGFCHLRGDMRSFRVDRIERAATSDVRFERPSSFDALSYVVQGIATLPRQFTFEVQLRTDMLRAQAEIMDVMGVLEPRDDGLVLRGSADDIDWLARQIAAFPFAFAVIKPDALRAALLRRAEELRAMAE